MSGDNPRYAALEAIKYVELMGDYTAAAVDALEGRRRAGEFQPPKNKTFDARALEDALQDARKVSAFAAFEQAARSCWGEHFGRDDAIRLRDLIDGLAARCAIPDERRVGLHAVREHRNDLVHLHRDRPARTLREVCRACAKFLAHFPDGWGKS